MFKTSDLNYIGLNDVVLVNLPGSGSPQQPEHSGDGY